MKKHLSKRRVIVAAFVAVALAIASSVAYAYWTSTGGGSSTLNSATPSTTITLTATGFDGISPGVLGKTVTFKAVNSSTSDGSVGTITFGSVTSTNPTCSTLLTTTLPNEFSMAAVDESHTVVPAGGTQITLPVTGTLIWADSTTVNQDACKNQPLTLAVTSS